MEVIGNALELRAFDRMEEDIRLVGYFKNKDSEREYLSFFLVKRGCEELCLALHYDRTASKSSSSVGFTAPFVPALLTQLPQFGTNSHAAPELT